MGNSEARLKEYEQDINDGGILIGIKPRSEKDARLFDSDWNQNRDNAVKV